MEQTLKAWIEKVKPNGWQRKIDRLATGKEAWDSFFEQPLDQTHPALGLKSSRGGHSLLHLAELYQQNIWAERLREFIPERPNARGMTPTEIGKFLEGKKGDLLKVKNLEIEDRDKLPQFEYLEEPMYSSAEVFESISSIDQIPSEKVWMGIYFKIDNHPKLTLKWVDETLGFGLFANQRISACTFVGEYTGIVKEGKIKKDNYYSVAYTVWGSRMRKYVIDAEKAGNYTRFINHSAKPNLGLQSIYLRGLPRMVLISLREIEKGDQLTFDYGNQFWKECPITPRLIE